MRMAQIEDRARLIPGEALRLVELAERRSLTLRITGSVAVGWHCPDHRPVMAELGRRPYHDIDYWALGSQMVELEQLFQSEGYVSDERVRRMREWGIKRLVLEHPESAVTIDVFMDELVMAHTIAFSDRLALPGPCTMPGDLLLSKLQIHEITENDLIDLAVLLAVNDLDALEAERVVTVISKEWGFWFDAVANLARLREALDRYEPLGPQRAVIAERVAALEDRLERHPKDRRWKLRARIGTRSRWYELVDEVNR